MKHERKKFGIRIIACSVALICSMSTVLVYAAATTDDPIISLSYLEKVFMPQIIQYIDQRFNSFTPNNNTSETAESYQVITLPAGKSVICDAGTEIILRAGNAQIIATIKGGIANVTNGTDLKNGSAVPSNHHLIVPVDDGRGISAQSDCILMIKGRYSIK